METRPLAPPPIPPRGYDANSRYDFHDGLPRHATERCLALKFKVQDLLDHKVISFTAYIPNAKNNQMSGHDGPNINTIKNSESNVLIQRMDQIKTLMSRICERLIRYEVFEELHDDCNICRSNPDKCEKMKTCLQQMMNQGLIQIGYSKKIEDVSTIESQGHLTFEIPYQRGEAHTSFWILVPLSFQTPIQIPVPMAFQIPVQMSAKSEDPIVFHVLAPFPYTDTKFIPWNYTATSYVGEKPIVLDPTVTNIAGV